MPEIAKQNTIATAAELTGRGLFTGCECTIKILPGEVNTGVIFRRTDLKDSSDIPANIEYVTQRQRRTALINGEASVETVEHLMSAIHALCLDNLIIEINAPEVPAMDGSALEFHKAISDAGIAEQNAEANAYIIQDTITISDGDAIIIATPPVAPGLDIVYDMDYSSHPAIGRQVLAFALGKGDYAGEIAGARTFILEKEVEYLKSQGFGKHLSETDLLVIGNDGPVKNEFRFPDECVRHKVCDLIGDLRLLGRPIQGRIMANRSGHSLNQKLVKKLTELIAGPKQASPTADESVATPTAENSGDSPKEQKQKPQKEQPKQTSTAKSGSDTQPAAPAMDIRKILRILPHRYPFLMIDRVLELLPDEKAVGVKNVTFNEPFFQGHYPGQPVMPGVLVLEAMAQLSGILLSRSLDNTNKVALLISMDRVKIRRAARPGDQLVITAESRQVRTRTGFCSCKSTIDGKLSAEAEIKFMLVDEELT